MFVYVYLVFCRAGPGQPPASSLGIHATRPIRSHPPKVHTPLHSPPHDTLRYQLNVVAFRVLLMLLAVWACRGGAERGRDRPGGGEAAADVREGDAGHDGLRARDGGRGQRLQRKVG